MRVFTPDEIASSSANKYLGVLVAALALDQGTKGLVYNLMAPHDEIKVIPGFFSIVHAQNPAAAMGLLGDNENRYYVFAAFTIFAVGFTIDSRM